MTLMPGQVLSNRYRVVKLLGQGGFGAVYKAWDMNLERPCALKENIEVSPAGQSQFFREAKILASLRHPGLPMVSDHFLIEGQGQYLIMDFVEGDDLNEKLAMAGGQMPEAQVLPWIEQVLDALVYMHRRTPPVIHRDIKPANIKVCLSDSDYSQGRAVLVDFGIAKVYDPQMKTTLGARAFTPGFSPHEQYGRGITDARTDIYAMGATVYMLLTGQEPVESIQRVVDDPLLPPRQLNPRISIQTEAVILRALQVNPAHRFQSAEEFRQVIGEQISGRGITLSEHNNINSGLGTGRTGQTSAFNPMQDYTGSTWLPPAQSILPQVPNPYIKLPVPAVPKPAQRMLLTLAPGIDLELVCIPAGEFWMGSDSRKDNDAWEDEIPQHKVFLPEFLIGKNPVTVAQFAAFVQAVGYKTKVRLGAQKIDNYPMTNVTFDDSIAFCAWVNQVTGRTIMLPSEAQWEKAARGNDGRLYPWGNQNPDKHYSNYDQHIGTTTQIGKYSPQGDSPFGCVDMAGNVWEWTRSLFSAYPYQPGDWREDLQRTGSRALREVLLPINKDPSAAARTLKITPIILQII